MTNCHMHILDVLLYKEEQKKYLIIDDDELKNETAITKFEFLITIVNKYID